MSKVRIDYDGNLIADVEANNLDQFLKGLNEALTTNYNIGFRKLKE
jgi:hypothetical protein